MSKKDELKIEQLTEAALFVLADKTTNVNTPFRKLNVKWKELLVWM